MLCVRHCVSHMRISGKQNQTGHLLSWGTVGMAEKNPVIAIMCVGAGSVFLHSHFASGLTCLLQQFINLKAWLSKPHGFGALDQHTEERAECPALMKHCPADSAPISEGKESWVGFVSQTEWRGWVLPLVSDALILGFAHSKVLRHYIWKGEPLTVESDLKVTSASQQEFTLLGSCSLDLNFLHTFPQFVVYPVELLLWRAGHFILRQLIVLILCKPTRSPWNYWLRFYLLISDEWSLRSLPLWGPKPWAGVPTSALFRLEAKQALWLPGHHQSFLLNGEYFSRPSSPEFSVECAWLAGECGFSSHGSKEPL